MQLFNIKILLLLVFIVNSLSVSSAVENIEVNPKKIIVKSENINLDDRIVTSVKNKLIAFLSFKYYDFEINLATKKIVLKEGIVFDDIKIKKLDSIKVNKRISVWVELLNKGKTIKELPLWFKVKAFNYVWTALDDINLNETILPSQFELQLKEVTGKEKQYFTVFPNKQVFWSVVKIKKGMPLMRKKIMPEPIIKRNQVVNVEYKSKSILIKIKGKALSNGFIGDKISVEIKESNRPVSVIIIDNDNVKVV